MLALALVAALVPAPASAATSAALGEQLRAKQAQADKVEKELAGLRGDLETKLTAYDLASEDLEGARQELSTTTARLDELDAQILQDESVLDARVVEMYKAGGYRELEVLLSTRNMRDFVESMDLITIILESDIRLLTTLRDARAESESLRAQQERRESELTTLRQEADAALTQVQTAVANQENAMKGISADIVQLVKEREAAAAAEAAAEAEARLRDGWTGPPLPFPPGTIISDANYLNVGSMGADAIQAFLDSQSGALKRYRGPDHNGTTKSAAQMIADACAAWGVSPKVVIATLQKEQSLISRTSPSQYALDWAMGCGKAESYTLSSYRGFGMQIWQGARVLIKNRQYWRNGISLSIDGKAVYPSNASTFSLYRYTPHFSGNTSFWRIYWRYFGDPNG